jgi:hypothetical protein
MQSILKRNYEMNLKQMIVPTRHWVSVLLLVLCAPCALGFSSNSVWAPSERGRGNFPPAPEGSLYAPGPPQKHMPPAPPLPHKQIPYSYARQIVMKHGWKPRPTTGNNSCEKMIYGVETCKKFPEIAATSVDGFCKMRFYKGRTQFNIFVYGNCDIKALSTKDYGEANVVGWEVVSFTDY